MKDAQHRRMQELLDAQMERQKVLAAIKAKTDLRIEIPLFDVKYRYATETETAHVAALLEKIPFSQPAVIDCAALPDSRQTEKPTQGGRAWLCFLSGAEEHMGLYIRGSVTDILADYDKWKAAVSGDLLMILGDNRHFVWISHDRRITEGLLPD